MSIEKDFDKLITEAKGSSNPFAIYELTPSPNGDDKRLVVIRESKGDCEKILTALEKNNINFDCYVIKELGA